MNRFFYMIWVSVLRFAFTVFFLNFSFQIGLYIFVILFTVGESIFVFTFDMALVSNGQNLLLQYTNAVDVTPSLSITHSH